jgi:hypothetical protein
MPSSLFKRQFEQFVDQLPQQLIDIGLAAVTTYPAQELEGSDSACDSEPRVCTTPLEIRGGAAHIGVARKRIASIFVFMVD